MTTAAPVDIDQLVDNAFTEGREYERCDVQTYLRAESESWEKADRPDIAGVLRRLLLDLGNEDHLTDTNWVPKTRPVVK